MGARVGEVACAKSCGEVESGEGMEGGGLGLEEVGGLGLELEGGVEVEERETEGRELNEEREVSVA